MVSTPTTQQLAELRRLADRYGLPVDLVDRLGLRPREVAKTIGVAEIVIRRLIRSGELGATRLGSAVIVPMQDLLSFLESNRVVPTDTAPASIDSEAAAFIREGA